MSARIPGKSAPMSNACAPLTRSYWIHPVWFDGLPAIMQGFFQRVFVPGVATVIDEKGVFHPKVPEFKAHGGGLHLWRASRRCGEEA